MICEGDKVAMTAESETTLLRSRFSWHVLTVVFLNIEKAKKLTNVCYYIIFKIEGVTNNRES